MSAYKKIACKFVDKEVLLQALVELGMSPQAHDVPQELKGYSFDKAGTAEIICRKADACGGRDFGFNWNAAEGVYDLVLTDSDEHARIPQQITQAYAKVAIEKALKAQKFSIKVSTPIEKLQRRYASNKGVKLQLVATKIG